MSFKRSKAVENTAIYIVLIIALLTTITPFYWMLNTSFKTPEEVFAWPPTTLPGWPPNLNNYERVFDLMPVMNATFNSLKIATLATFGTLLTSSLAAYAFAKLTFRGKHGLFMTFLATIMIPGQVTLIPLYIVFSEIQWIDTHLPLMVPFMLLNAYGVFLLRQFMLGIPDAYIDAAKIDGANHFQIYLRIILPLCKPALITLGLFSFIGNWNNFLGPLIFLSTDKKFTLPLIVNSFRTVYNVEWGLLMAASCIAIVPCLILYMIAQRYFIEGVSLAGLKG